MKEESILKPLYRIVVPERTALGNYQNNEYSVWEESDDKAYIKISREGESSKCWKHREELNIKSSIGESEYKVTHIPQG